MHAVTKFLKITFVFNMRLNIKALTYFKIQDIRDFKGERNLSLKIYIFLNFIGRKISLYLFMFIYAE